MRKANLLLLMLIFPPATLAQPGAPIMAMMQTPASVFDLFLFRLYEEAKCNTVVQNNNSEEADLCMSTLKYDSERNILSVFFRVRPAALSMEDFVDQEAEGRKQIMLQLLENTAKRVGAIDSWGLLHSLPIAYGPLAAAADEKLFRSELAKRTATRLSTSYDGKVFVATRHQDGRIEYFTR